MAKPSVINPLKYVVDRQFSDSLVIKNKIFQERLFKARNFYRKDLFAHYGCVNAIEFSPEGELLVSGGDDRRVLLWTVQDAIFDKKDPIIMNKTHLSNIFCVAFDSRNEKIYSGGNDDQVLIHEVASLNSISSIPHKKPVYGLSVNPQNDEIISTAGEDGRLLLFDVREAPNEEAQVLAKQKTGFHSVMFNPTNPRFLVSANSEEGIALWDCRKPKEELLKYDANSGKSSGISARFDSTGKKVLALRRRLPPVLYKTQSDTPICQFYHPQYYNSCTMKTCSFAGDNDEYILSGSDDFNLYMWKTPEDECEWGTSHMVLRGHRSIVNQVRYNKHNNLIASSGVEKMIKLWSTMPIGTWRGSLLKEHSDPARIVYTHQDYVDLVGGGGDRISHDYSDQSVLEDAKMMAFFDSLIQREIEGWVSSSDDMLTSDSDTDDQEQDWSKVISKMFKNGRSLNEEPKKQWFNKISLLIMKKRNKLAKMAHCKSPSTVEKSHQKEQLKKDKLLKQKFKSSQRFSNRSYLKKSPRKHSPSKRSKSVSENTRPFKYRTRLSLREFPYDSLSSSNLLDGPSTSTGITGSRASVFRILDQDSEDEISTIANHSQPSSPIVEEVDEEDNLINILPTPLNGSQDRYINALEMSNGTNSEPSSTNGHVTERSEENSRASTSGSTSEAFEESPSKVLSIRSNGTSNGACNGVVSFSDSDSDNDYGFEYHTPVKKRRKVSASDSGCGTGPSSSSSAFSIRQLRSTRPQCSTTNGNGLTAQSPSSDEEYKYEKFRKRVRKAKVNFRNHVGIDSDSN